MATLAEPVPDMSVIANNASYCILKSHASHRFLIDMRGFLD